MNRLLLLLALISSPVFAAERQVINPDQDGNLVLRVNDGGTVRDAYTVDGATTLSTIGYNGIAANGAFHTIFGGISAFTPNNWDTANFSYILQNTETSNSFGNTLRVIGGGGSGAGNTASTIFQVETNDASVKGKVDGIGQWTLGPSAFTSTHTINGRIQSTINTSGITQVTVENDTASTSTTDGLMVTFPNVASVNHDLLVLNSNAVDQFKVRGNGTVTVTTTNWGTGGTAIGVSGGALTTSPSSSRYKENIAALATEVDTTKIFNLTPVVFDYKAPQGGKHSFGLIAEAVYAELPALVHREPDPENPETLRPESVAYDHLSVLLLAELKKLRNEFDAYVLAHP